MNRCLPLTRLRALLVTGLSLVCLSAWAQLQISLPSLDELPPDAQRIPPVSAKAKYGVLRVVSPPEILLNEKPARLSPGSRIRGKNNLMVMSASLIGEDMKVLYTLEPTGMVHEVWILTDREIVALTPPKPLPVTY